MLLLRNIKILSIIAMGIALSACSSTQATNAHKEDVIQEGRTYSPLHKQTLVESSTFSSDKQNARYEELETKYEENVSKYDELEEGTVIIASAQSKPVGKDSLDDIKATVDENINVVETNESYEPSVSYQIATILFGNGSASIDSDYNQKIREVAKLAKDKNAMINVYGFASSRTKNTDVVNHKMINFNISMKRAENVVAALKRAGVPSDNITMEALSDTQPLYQEVMPEGERLNRRAEIYISY